MTVANNEGDAAVVLQAVEAESRLRQARRRETTVASPLATRARAPLHAFETWIRSYRQVCEVGVDGLYGSGG